MYHEKEQSDNCSKKLSHCINFQFAFQNVDANGELLFPDINTCSKGKNFMQMVPQAYRYLYNSKLSKLSHMAT